MTLLYVQVEFVWSVIGKEDYEIKPYLTLLQSQTCVCPEHFFFFFLKDDTFVFLCEFWSRRFL